MQLHILKLQTCSLNTLLCVICPLPCRTPSVVHVFSLSFSFLKINKQTTKVFTESCHFSTSFLVFSQWFQLTSSPLNQPRICSDGQQQSCLSLWAREEQQGGIIPVHTPGNLFITAVTNSMHLILKESMKRHLICVIQAPRALKLHS